MRCSFRRYYKYGDLGNDFQFALRSRGRISYSEVHFGVRVLGLAELQLLQISSIQILVTDLYPPPKPNELLGVNFHKVGKNRVKK